MLRGHRMTRRTAELTRIHVSHTAVRCGGNDGDVQDRQESDQTEESNRRSTRWNGNVMQASAALRTPPHTNRDRGKSPKEEGGKYEEHDDAVIRIGKTLKRQRNENYCRCRNDDRAGRSNPVTENVRDERLKDTLHAAKSDTPAWPL